MKSITLKILLAATLIVAFTSLKAQNLLVGISGGVATFGMNSTKEFNKYIVTNLPFTPVLKQNFPPWIFSKAEVLYCFPKKCSIGLTLVSTSTGSRYTLSDYSGSYKMDNIQKGLFPGIKVLFGDSPNKLKFALETGVAFSSMTLIENVTIASESNSDKSDLTAMGLFIQPGICFSHVVNQKIRLSANLSYYYGIEKGYHLPGHKNQRVINPDSHNPVKPQWDGIRFGISAYWSVRNYSKKN